MAKLILLRHGQSQWNLENRFTGWVDVDLSEKGEAEAVAAGKKLATMPIDRIFTSTLKRAIRTADLALLHHDGEVTAPVERSTALNERHYGDLQGLNKAETAAKFGDDQVHIWRRSFDVKPPNGESLKDTCARVIPYFEKHILPHVKAGQNVLVAAHGNSLRGLMKILDKLSDTEITKLEIPTGVPIVYDMDSLGHVLNKQILE